MRSRSWMHLTGTMLMLLLVTAHVFHLHAAWERSKVAIVDAVFKVTAATNAGAMALYQEWLSKEVHSEGGDVPGFKSSVYVSNGDLYVSFALQNESRAGAILSRMEEVSQTNTGTKVPNPEKTNMPASCGQTDKPGTKGKGDQSSRLKLSQVDVRHLPWIKPLDVIVLLVLSGALGIWLRKARYD